MTDNNYSQQAITLESATNDADQVPIPFGALGLLATYARQLDFVKRECFYAKKPDEARVQKVLTECNDLADAISEWQDTFRRHYGDVPMTFAFTEVNHRLLHAILGILTEAGEMAEALLWAIVKDEQIDLDNLREEFGDLEWYPALGRHEAEILDGERGRFTQDSIQRANLAKLGVRYNSAGQYGGDRDLEAEKAAMDAAA
jgi:NTP pyrophosphatase (non-canonical NTP hydrolase)